MDDGRGGGARRGRVLLSVPVTAAEAIRQRKRAAEVKAMASWP